MLTNTYFDFNSMKKLRLIFVLSLFTSFSTFAQTTDYKFQSLFVYNIAKLAKWTPDHEAGDFKIAILGNKQVAETMSQALTNKKVGAQNIKVEVFNDINDVSSCHILFVPATTKVPIEKLTKVVEKNNIMLVTERDGWGRKGSAINFIMVDGKMKFEVNQEAAQKANVKLSNSLTAMGIVL
ncbi:protein of unknown function [Flexibacter flexilis DSM 6793]|uniref:YfiR family protein n=2 Tax=Flexibacter flexilis TaxID=998 RepID=A0A1I1D8U5_9BACT|nr:protein of unknown function [Flexibacter flexilis DSM 6793]